MLTRNATVRSASKIRHAKMSNRTGIHRYGTRPAAGWRRNRSQNPMIAAFSTSTQQPLASHRDPRQTAHVGHQGPISFIASKAKAFFSYLTDVFHSFNASGQQGHAITPPAPRHGTATPATTSHHRAPLPRPTRITKTHYSSKAPEQRQGASRPTSAAPTAATHCTIPSLRVARKGTFPPGVEAMPSHPEYPNLTSRQELGVWLYEQGLLNPCLLDAPTVDSAMLELTVDVLESFLDDGMADSVKSLLTSIPIRQLATDVVQYLTPETVRLCNQSSEATISDIQALPKVTSKDFGSYLCIVSWPNGIVELYVGSATGSKAGLVERVRQHRSLASASNDSALCDALRKNATLEFRTISVMPGTHREGDIARRTYSRFIAVLTEAVFHVLLGSFSDGRPGQFIWGRQPNNWVGKNRMPPLYFASPMDASIPYTTMRKKARARSAKSRVQRTREMALEMALEMLD